jgi:competence protein ComEA
MAIDDFEWEGELTQPSQTKLAQQAAARPSWLARVRSSVWLEPALRLGGAALLLGALAGIGIVATTYAKPGRPLPEGPRSLAAALGSSWLKPTTESAKDEHAHAPAPASGAVSVASASASASAAASVPRAPEPSAGVANGGVSAGVTADGKVILNLASATELTKLPGVGMKRAEAIVALRTKLKRFRQPTDLLRVKGIGPRGLKRMLPHLVLDAP